MLKWLKHAFAVESSGTAIPSPEQAQAIDLVCREVVRRGMTLPAQMVLESSMPLHYLAGQSLRFLEPFMGVVLDPAAVRNFATFLEKQGAVEYICQRLKELESAHQATAGTPHDPRSTSSPATREESKQ